jgi:hypothetical protein
MRPHPTESESPQRIYRAEVSRVGGNYRYNFSPALTLQGLTNLDATLDLNEIIFRYLRGELRLFGGFVSTGLKLMQGNLAADDDPVVLEIRDIVPKAVVERLFEELNKTGVFNINLSNEEYPTE